MTQSASTCPECGASLAAGRSCLDYFHDLLVLEATVPGAPGAEPHFLAVASYNLQHPSGFMPGALVGLKETLADVLAGKASLAQARARARAGAEGAMRVRRRPDTQLPAFDRLLLDAWPRAWTMTVRDVTEMPATHYVEQVRAWASSIVASLAQAFIPLREPTLAGRSPCRLNES